ncbi:hypothetical protein C2G38_2253077 [Gigaspora rosea]|uniref:Signal transduction histidine kinase dimerisation/phosphoacceptor domain-containing protein n=1 Tax=Gigaspora rosea TaxID=44941 RepID=A0A397UC34_9GLOM|nr:hypothetical protein C2G38_2253077 [Gigaspora rosea]
MASSYWGCIKLHRSSNSIWLNSEIELLQQISNQIGLAIFYKTLIEENLEKEIQIKAESIANKTKTQILANTSHELRTPLETIIGLISLFDFSTLTDDQKDMIDIIQLASDSVLSIVNNILNAAKLEAQQIASINTAFDLLYLFEKIIEQFTKDLENKPIEFILNYNVENIPRYIKGDPERIKFTEAGEIILYVSIKPQKGIDDNTCSQIVKNYCLLIELHDTGNVKKVDAFVTPLKNKDEIMKALLELREMDIMRDVIVENKTSVSKRTVDYKVCQVSSTNQDLYDENSKTFALMFMRNCIIAYRELIDVYFTTHYSQYAFDSLFCDVSNHVYRHNAKEIMVESLIYGIIY